MRSSTHSSRLWVILPLWAIVAACPAASEGIEPALAGRRITAIEFRCVAPIDVAGLTALMPMRVGDPLRSSDLMEAQRRLVEKRIFTAVTIEPHPHGDDVALVVHLERRVVVDRVRFKGNNSLRGRELRRVTRVRENTILDEGLLDYSVQRLHARYAAEGFDQARITAQVQPRSGGEADVVFHIDEGEAMRIAAIEIEGGSPLSNDEINAASGLGIGDRFAPAKEREAERAIVRVFRKRHYFEVRVAVEWKPGPGRNGILRFAIDPGPLFTLEFSGNRRFKDKKLLRVIDLWKRPIVTDGTWRELGRRATRLYRENGYYFASVDLEIQEGPPKEVRFNIDEGGRFIVAGIGFDGARELLTKKLRAAMTTGPPSWFPWRRGVLLDETLDDDLQRLLHVYRRNGFESASIIDTRKSFDRQQGKVLITIFIDEGLQTIVDGVETAGLELVADRLPELNVELGKPLDPEELAADRQALRAALASLGYTQAAVRTDVETRPSGAFLAATVHLRAELGEQQRVGFIHVQDSIDTRESVIRRELPFARGDPLDPTALLVGQSNLYGLGLFRSVTVRPLGEDVAEPEDDGQALERASPELEGSEDEPNAPPSSLGSSNAEHDIAVTVAERPPGSLEWGAGYNTRDGIRGFLEVAHGNLQGLARRASLRGELNLEPGDAIPNEYLGNLGFRAPGILDSRWTFRSNLIAQRSTRSVDEFSIARLAFIPAIERTFLPGLEAGVDVQIEQARVFDLEADVEAFNPRDAGSLRTVSFGPFVVYDRRDDAFVPTRGMFESLRLRLAPEQLGTEIPFLKVLGQHSQHVPLGHGLAFVYSARGNWALPFKGSDIIPIRERFFLGGRTTVRGFSENSIGPRGSDDNPLGGDLAVNANTELRFPLLFGVGGVVFADGGGLYFQDTSTCRASGGRGCALSLSNFRRSAGLGLRYITPVGPVSLEYGFKLDRRSDESIGEIHFSIGTIF